jgi:hypothetical protein
MNLWFKLLAVYTPEFLRKRGLQVLYDITARGLRCTAPGLNGEGYEDCLEEYALFAREQTLRALNDGDDISDLRKRLFRISYKYGKKIRENLNVTSQKEVNRVSKYLYKNIYSDFYGNENGGFSITKCYFSQFYTPDVCKVTSAVDAGLLSGLQGGGYLVFSDRITEGKSSCKACLLVKEKQFENIEMIA